MQQRLNRKLIELNKEGLYPLHMPGHKRNSEKLGSYEDSFSEKLRAAYEIDITEIDGFDNLHDAKDLIKDAENRAADLYKSEETHFLVNGSTSGILSAIASVSKKGDKIIVARNCHISVYNAIELNELSPVYVYPETVDLSDEKSFSISGSVRTESIEKAVINNPNACAVVITSPTYDGVVSDVAEIARLAHEYDMPLIVDEAHGALFYIEGRSALDCKADIVINSVHKTLPSLTQTALIHVQGTIVDRSRLRKFLRIYQTSSPSYVLMGSIDYAVELMENDGNRLYREFCVRTMSLKDKLSKLKNLKYISKDILVKSGVFDFDESKVLISTAGTGINGKDLYIRLKDDYGLQPEMAAGEYVLLMTTVFDSDEGINKLSEALLNIDNELLGLCNSSTNNSSEEMEDDEISFLKSNINDPYEKTVFAYPPGIPIIVKGEILTEDKYAEIKNAVDNNLDVKFID